MALCMTRSVVWPRASPGELTTGRRADTPLRSLSAAMGGCHSGCHAPSRELEYYDAWRHQAPRTVNRRGGRAIKRTVASPSRVWECADGCCSIRWKIDYEGLGAYAAHAQLAPYVVMQDVTGECRCVICCGVSTEASPARSDSSWSLPSHKARSIPRKHRPGSAGSSTRTKKASFASSESLTDDEELML